MSNEPKIVPQDLALLSLILLMKDNESSLQPLFGINPNLLHKRVFDFITEKITVSFIRNPKRSNGKNLFRNL